MKLLIKRERIWNLQVYILKLDEVKLLNLFNLNIIYRVFRLNWIKVLINGVDLIKCLKITFLIENFHNIKFLILY